MKPGEAFEIQCYEYLRREYTTPNCTFVHNGGMDSTISDIAVLKDGIINYFIEVKDSAAQSGQFVLLPNEHTKTFVYSPRNHSVPNEMTKIMIDYMNLDFDRFNNAGTSGESIDINPAVFANWIIKHYQRKRVKFIMSYKYDYVILPVRKFATYFDIQAKYRIKKSGSSKPAKKDIPAIVYTIRQSYPLAKFSGVDEKLFVTIPNAISKSNDKFILGNHTYYFSKHSNNYYEIRRLSNTYNMNVIFSIQLKKTQDIEDLKEFESDL